LETLSASTWPRLSSGASPAGTVGVVQGRAQVHRRIAMIARFDKTDLSNRARWSAPGVLLSLLVAGIALTGAVRSEACDQKDNEEKATAVSAAEAVPAAPAAEAPEAPESKETADAEAAPA